MNVRAAKQPSIAESRTLLALADEVIELVNATVVNNWPKCFC